MENKKTYKRIILFTLIFTSSLIIGLFLGWFIGENYYTFSILKGTSMLPEYTTNDIVLLKIINNNCYNLQVGDDISFYYKDLIVFHRIINITDEGIITKGLNNNFYDPLILCEDVIGKKIFKYQGFRLERVLI